MQSGKRAFEGLVRDVIECRRCFELRDVKAPVIDVAQPRSVGPKYWTSQCRIAVVMLNPGQSGDNDQARDFVRHVRLFQSRKMLLDTILAGQREVMPTWGRPSGRFGAFFVQGLGLSLDEVAFANVAWCATAGNNYPPTMLRRCFSEHTGALLKVLDPAVVILSGTTVYRFDSEIRELLPSATLVRSLHYAHRKGRDVQRREATRVRAELVKARAARRR